MSLKLFQSPKHWQLLRGHLSQRFHLGLCSSLFRGSAQSRASCALHKSAWLNGQLVFCSTLWGTRLTAGLHLPDAAQSAIWDSWSSLPFYLLSRPPSLTSKLFLETPMTRNKKNYDQQKKKSIFYVKNKPILGGIIHLQIVTLRPGRTVNPRCVPVTDLGFGFLIWLRDVQKPQVVNSSLLAMHLRGSRTLFIPASVWNTLYSINWLLLLPFWRIWRICILCWNKCTLPK